jgi:hypothetical protein
MAFSQCDEPISSPEGEPKKWIQFCLVKLSDKRLSVTDLCIKLRKLFATGCPTAVKNIITAYYSRNMDMYSYCRRTGRYVSSDISPMTDDEFTSLFEPFEHFREGASKVDAIWRKMNTNTLYQSYMRTSFTRPAIEQVFSDARVAQLNDLRDIAGLPHIIGRDIFALIEVTEWLESFLDLGECMTYVSDRGLVREKTVKAVWPNKSEDEREFLHEKLRRSKPYRKAVELAGIFRGRLHTMLTSAMTQECAIADKHGLFKLSVDQEYDIPTLVWCLFLLTDLNARNAFTLDSQQHGGLSPFLRTFLDKYLSTREETDWSMIAYLYPTARVLEHVSADEKQKMLDAWMRRLNGMKMYLQTQWDLGVKNCTGDGGKHPAWTVPRRGSGVDSTGYNGVAGSWNNGLRYIKLLSSQAGIPYPMLFTCPKLTAGDQAQWAYAEKMEVPPKVLALTELIHKGTLPWAVLDGVDSGTILSGIIDVSTKYDVPLEKFLGLPQERVTELRIHHDMICGVAVTCSKATAEALKSFGFAGAHQSSSATT